MRTRSTITKSWTVLPVCALLSLTAQAVKDVPARAGKPGSSSQTDDITRVPLPTCKPVEGKFAWSLKGVSLKEVADQISNITCKRFISLEGVKNALAKKVELTGELNVDADQAWSIFLAMLQSNGVGLVHVNRVKNKGGERYDVYRFEKRDDIARQPTRVYTDGRVPPVSEETATVVYELKHATKDTTRSTLRSLMSRTGTISASGDDFLILVDSSANLRRILRILKEIDVPGASDMVHTINLEYAEASDLQKKLTEIFELGSKRNMARRSHIRPGSDGGGGDDFSIQKIIADDRANRLLVVASDKGLQRVKETVKLLDTPPSEGFSQDEIHVYRVKHGDAKKIHETVSRLVQESSRKRSSSGSNDQANKGEVFEGEVRMAADEGTNALVIIASPKDYRSVRRMLNRLDEERVQVHIEAVIMDISINDNNEFGLNVFGAFPTPGIGNSLSVAGNPGGLEMGQGAIASLVKDTSAGSAAALGNFIGTLGVMGPGVTVPGTSIQVPSFGAVLKAVQTQGSVDVLSTPSVMTLNNKKAELSTGKRVPVSTGTISLGSASKAAESLGIPLNQIRYQDAKLKVLVTPHVSDDDQVRLEIEQDVTDLGAKQVIGGQEHQIFDTKQVKTVVLARDQQTVIIGGLISTKTTMTENKVPLLGDIPLLGWLFKGRKKEKRKRNLVLALTVTVVRTDADHQKIYHRKMREREEFARMQLGRKSQPYNPYINYEQKLGPLQQASFQLTHEMLRVENGGPGLPNETVIQPQPRPDKTPNPQTDGELEDGLEPSAITGNSDEEMEELEASQALQLPANDPEPMR
ncbi:MAG: type II secretion system secretin GspD [Myxococcota bacterium]